MRTRALNKDEFKVTIAKWASDKSAAIALLYHEPGYRYSILKIAGDRLDDAISGDMEKGNPALRKLAQQGKLLGCSSALKEDIPSAGKNVTQFVAEFVSRRVKPTLSSAEFRKFYDRWLELSSAKRTNLPSKIANAVFARAGGCCEFRGCGEGLYRAKGHGDYGNFGYFAHIVGAQLDGPRGDDPMPLDERNEADNLLLLCDVHHRLIDRVAPDEYSSQALRQMRDESEVDRDNYSQFRKFPAADVLTVLTDIMGVTTDVEQRQILESLQAKGLRPSSRHFRSLMRDARGGLDANVPTYWGQFIETYKNQIRLLIEELRGDGQVGSTGRRLAVFALGNMPALVLAGRLIGEARPFELFHFNRNRNSWAWPTTATSPNRASVSYSLGEDRTPQEEVVIALEVTAKVDESRLSERLKALPRITIGTEWQDQNPFSSPAELTELREKMQRAVNLAQDVLKAQTVHLMTLAPADCVLAMGMKLQARNHARVHVYQMPRDQEYFCALILSSNEISSPNSPKTLSLE